MDKRLVCIVSVKHVCLLFACLSPGLQHLRLCAGESLCARSSAAAFGHVQTSAFARGTRNAECQTGTHCSIIDARILICPCLYKVVKCRTPALAQARAGEICCCGSCQAVPRCLHGRMQLFIGSDLADLSSSFTTCPPQAHGFSTTAAHVPHLNQPGCIHGGAETSGWMESLSLLGGRLPSIL